MPDHSTYVQVCHQNPLSTWNCPTCPMDVHGMSIRHPTLTDQACPIVLSSPPIYRTDHMVEYMETKCENNDNGQLASFPGSLLKNGEGESQVTVAGNVVDFWDLALLAPTRLQNETMHTSEILSTEQKVDNSCINTNYPSKSWWK